MNARQKMQAQSGTIHIAAKHLYDLGHFSDVLVLLAGVPRSELVRDPQLCMMAAGSLSRLYRATEAMDLLEDLRPFIYSARDSNALRRWQNGYAIHLMHCGRLSEAEELLNQSLQNSEVDNDVRSVAFACNSLGNLVNTQGRLELATQYYGRAVTAWQQIGDKRGVGLGHFNLSGAFREWERLTEASKHCLLAEEYLSDGGSVGDRLLVRFERTMILLAFNENKMAERSARQTVAAAASIGNAYLSARADRSLGAALLANNLLTEARERLEAALDTVRQEPNQLLEASIQEDLAVIALLEERNKDAEDLKSVVLTLYRGLGAKKSLDRAVQRFLANTVRNV